MLRLRFRPPHLAHLSLSFALLGAGLATSGCSTPKETAAEALGPEITIHTVPEGATVTVKGSSPDAAPITRPVHRADKVVELSVQHDGYFPGQATYDSEALAQAGGGELWVPLKPVSMGDATGPLAPDSANDIDRAGVSTGKAGHCDDALQFFARALAIDPSLARVYKDRARCLFKLHRRNEAIAALDKYVLVAQDAPDVEKVSEQIAKARANQDIDLYDEKAEKK